MIAHFIPQDEELHYGRRAEDVEIVGPAGGAATGLAFVAHGLDTGRKFLAWADELCLVAAPAEVLR